jgi:hypothetical protein
MPFPLNILPNNNSTSPGWDRNPVTKRIPSSEPGLRTDDEVLPDATVRPTRQTTIDRLTFQDQNHQQAAQGMR